MKKLKLALIFSSDFENWPMGGMLSFVRDALPELKKYFEIDVWGVTGETPAEKRIIQIGILNFELRYFAKVKTSGRKIIPNVVRVMWGIYKNRKKILRMGYDALYFHGEPLIIAFQTKKKTKPLKVLHQHGTSISPEYPKRIYEFMQKLSVRFSHITFVSALNTPFLQYKNSLFSLFEQHKLIRVNNFADPDIFKPMPRDVAKRALGFSAEEVLFLFSGRLDIVKDPIFAITAFYEYIKKYKVNAKLLIAGDGPLLEKCVSHAKSLGVIDNIVFYGKVCREKVALMINASSLLIFTSLMEGMPMSIIEALLCDTPIITSAWKGVCGLIRDYENGYIVKNRDPELYADKMRELVEIEDELRSKILSNREKFIPSKVVKSISEYIYKTYEKYYGE